MDPGLANRFFDPIDLESYQSLVRKELQRCVTDADLLTGLRRFRNREMVRLAWRDIAGWASIESTLRECSDLAEAVVRETVQRLFADACSKTIVPIVGDGSAQPLLILGMGKLGAWELNFSSDIDLIFAYREEGVLRDRRGTTFAEFYTKLARRLIQALDQVTEEGFVFRVDMRLRPFGESGPLVLNFDAMEVYYQSQAREWERYAMVKARPIAGEPSDARAMETILQPFVYRRYLDYRAFGELRVLKEKITQELRRNDRLDNIKLGPGGIREIEFIGQAFQLIRGGRDKALQDRRILHVLGALAQHGQLPAAIVTKLAEAYRFLRTVENRLQQYDDQQTHELPTGPAPQALLAYGMGFTNWTSFKQRLDKVRAQVHEVFEQIMASPHTEGGGGSLIAGDASLSADSVVAMGFPDSRCTLELLQRFSSSRAVKKLSARGADELNRLLPLVLRAVVATENPDVVLERILRLLEAVASRNVYFSLLAENPLALSQLVKLATASAWIVHHITQSPILLDELLDPRALYRPLTRKELTAQLQQEFSSIERSDVEQVMVALRHFKQANVLRVAATDIMGTIPIMVVSDYLTDIAETVVDAVLRLAWQLTAARHGVPTGSSPEEIRHFGVVAYGKLGGIELGYGSDLDLVFLHDCSDGNAMTSGPHPTTVAEFYARVAKRMVSLMTTQMHAGLLYEVDLRLRPSGNSGLLVSSLDAYAAYQIDAAWTWEQQSLVRARFIAGDRGIGERFREIRAHSLTRPADRVSLRREVREMREKMRGHLEAKDPYVFDLKQGFGGIADIEFLVQYGVLANAHSHHGLVRWTDTVRLLEGLRDIGFLSAEDADHLRRAYCHFRERAHRSALQELPSVVAVTEDLELRERVQLIWRGIMEA